jgi:AcrR family transcriptional regulator
MSVQTTQATQAAPRRRRQERSRLTRLRLLEATVECLADYGWSGATTTVIAERAGVSRGAQQNHFPTRDELVLAAVEHLVETRLGAVRRAAAQEPGGRLRTEAVLERMASLYTGPAFSAALELWVAARTDAGLRAAVAPLEARIGREAHRLAVELLGADESRPGVREVVQATLDLMRGLGLASQLTDDARRRDRLLAEWARLLDHALHEPRGPGEPPPGPPR